MNHFKKICAPLALVAILFLSILAPASHAAATATFLPGESISANLRVKVSGSTIVTAGATDAAIGTVISAATTANLATVVLSSEGEILPFVASAAITVGSEVYPAASGKVSSTTSGSRIGRAVKAAAADGDIVQVLVLRSDSDRVVVTKTFNASSVDDWVFVADRPYTVVSIKEVHSVAGNDGGTVTADVRKVTDVSAPGAAAGSTVKEFMSAALNLKSTANTTVTGTLSGTASDLDLATGDKIGVNFIGTLTTLAGGVLVIELKTR